MGCGWTNDEDIGDEKIKLRLAFGCCIDAIVGATSLRKGEAEAKLGNEKVILN